MEEEAPSRRSVAELAGRFKGSAAPHDAAGQETEKPVRRRPPRSLQLPKPHGDDQEPAGVTSPLPTKVKRNSALIEKLQANLALSPSALLPSPKSPGFRLLPPAFPGSGPVTAATTPSTATPTSPAPASPLTEQEGPASFEAPPTVEEGAILSNANIKGRARLSIRRRPPSRRHRKSSSGDEVGVANEGGDTSLKSPTEPEDKTREEEEGGGEKERRGEDQTDEVKDDKTDEVKDDKTDEMKDDKTDEVKDDKADEVKDDQTDEVKDDKTDEVKDDKTDEVKDDKTDEVKDDETDEVKDDNTNPSPCPEKNESEDHTETSVEPREEEEKKKEEGKGSTGGKEEDGSSSGKTEKKNSEEKQEDLTQGATNTDIKEEEKAEETTSQSSVR